MIIQTKNDNTTTSVKRRIGIGIFLRSPIVNLLYRIKKSMVAVPITINESENETSKRLPSSEIVMIAIVADHK